MRTVASRVRTIVAMGVLAATLAVAAPAAAQPSRSDSAADLPTVPVIFAPTAPWQEAALRQAQSSFNHPSWGYRHSERIYALAWRLVRAEGLDADDDVLFAAALLHDWGGIDPYEVEGTPHQARSVELAEPFLREAGFPMDKWPAVRDAILGHVPAGEPTTPEGVVLHDADLLDFIGAEGIARFLAAPSDEPTVDQGLNWIESFGLTLGDRLLTDTARRLAEPRLAYMRGFLEQLRSEIPPGTQP